jgi:hypothetical protein
MELVAFVGNDKENWGQVTGLINRGDWEKIFLVKTKDSKEFSNPKTSEVFIIDTKNNLTEIKTEIMEKFKGKFNGFDIGLSIASGTGKEHMALISALLSIPVGIRLVVFTKKGVEIIS